MRICKVISSWNIFLAEFISTGEAKDAEGLVGLENEGYMSEYVEVRYSICCPACVVLQAHPHWYYTTWNGVKYLEIYWHQFAVLTANYSADFTQQFI